ncbi:MAG: neutral zinc metallopeptidase [Pseudomonadales bacterium]|jgi:predicted metalloprotease|nr:neutral zinc metallopeptidase [Pseudomonadales bacterium]
MKWRGQRRSENIEDRRGAGGVRRPIGLPGGGRGGLGLGTIAIVLVVGWFLGINPLTLLGALSGGAVPVTAERSAAPPADDDQAAFVATVLADTEEVWGQLFSARGDRYRDPVLVLFRDATRSACGLGQAAMGPFYCPADQRVYIDLGFFDTLHRRLGAPGDFAQAYVVAHEVGHHVQQLMGVTQRVDALRGRVGETEMNALSVRVELQADCLAGVWAHHSQRGKGWLEDGDVEEAMNAAAQIGDDTLQRRSQGRVVPESFTHGTSAQRMEWFQRGMVAGEVQRCDTFEAALR